MTGNPQGQVLAIILSASSSKGGVLLFRYPVDNGSRAKADAEENQSQNG